MQMQRHAAYEYVYQYANFNYWSNSLGEWSLKVKEILLYIFGDYNIYTKYFLNSFKFGKTHHGNNNWTSSLCRGCIEM